MIKPVRVQRKRVKGFNLQAASPNGLPVVYVGRPSRWGNPFEVTPEYSRELAVQMYALHLSSYFGWVVRETARAWKGWPVQSTEFEDWIRPLRGKNLACWCGIRYNNDERIPCHADILLELANEGYKTPTNRKDVCAVSGNQVP